MPDKEWLPPPTGGDTLPSPDEELEFVRGPTTSVSAICWSNPYALVLAVAVTCTWKLGKLGYDYPQYFEWASPQSPKQRAEYLRLLRKTYPLARPLLLESEEELNSDDARFLLPRSGRVDKFTGVPAIDPSPDRIWYSKYSGLGPPPPRQKVWRTPTPSIAYHSGLLDEGPHITLREYLAETSDERD